MPVIVNAEVTNAFVGFHSSEGQHLTLVVHCKTGDGEGMMEGHYYMAHPRNSQHHQDDTPLGEVIRGWLEAAGVERVDQMPGRYVRLELPDQMSAIPNRVGHIVDEGLWFSTHKIMSAWGDRLTEARRNAAAYAKATTSDGEDQ